MPFASGDNARIRTNISAQNAFNALEKANKDISLRQLRLSTGKRINSAADDVAAYITSRSLISRNSSLKSSLLIVGDAQNTSNIAQDGLSSINDILNLIKQDATTASSGALGTDEKIALAKAAFRMVEQIQTVVDSTVFGGQQLITGDYRANFFVGVDAKQNLLTLDFDLTVDNPDFNVSSFNFNVNAMTNGSFAGVTNLDLTEFNEVSANNLGIFSENRINSTIFSLSEAMNNANKAAAYLGGISNRLSSQEDILRGQIVNYNAAISRLEDADVAFEQLQLVKSQFLQQTSLTSLAQSNQNPASFLQLISQ